MPEIADAWAVKVCGIDIGWSDLDTVPALIVDDLLLIDQGLRKQKPKGA